MALHTVMAGLVPAIHEKRRALNHVDARHKAGHDAWRVLADIRGVQVPVFFSVTLQFDATNLWLSTVTGPPSMPELSEMRPAPSSRMKPSFALQTMSPPFFSKAMVRLWPPASL